MAKDGKTSMVLYLNDDDHMFARKLQLEREVEGHTNDKGKKETLADIVVLLVNRGIEATKEQRSL